MKVTVPASARHALELRGVGSGCPAPRVIVLRRHPPRKECVERQPSGADDEQKDGAHKHREVQASHMQRRPEPILITLPVGFRSGSEEKGDLGCGDRHQHIDNQRDGGQPREQTQQNESSGIRSVWWTS